MSSWTVRLLVCAALLASSTPAFAQRQVPPRGALPGTPPAGVPGAEAPGIPPAEIQRLFDAYALLQAQDQLRITGDQSLQFLAKFKDLQDVRRRALVERMRGADG